MIVDALALRPVLQTTEYSCGPCALLCGLRYLGVAGKATERSLIRETGCDPSIGTLETGLLAAASARWSQSSVRARITVPELCSWLEGGSVPVLTLQAWRAPGEPDYDDPDTDAGHYSVAAGACESGIVLADSSLRKLGRMTWEDLDQRWHCGATAPRVALLLKHSGGPRRRVQWGSLPWVR